MLSLIALALLAGSCGRDGVETGSKRLRGDANVETGLAEAGKPVRGGRIVYAVEAETTGGFCLPEAQLGPAGNLIRQAIYDSLTYMDKDSQAKPFLAKSVTPDADYKTWTVVLRDGVKFHDGTPLDAQVVKNNLDAFLGKYPKRAGTLFPIVLSNIAEVTVIGDQAIVITTKTPWPALPVYLTMLGMMAQAQLDDEDTCESNLIGTGPFTLSSWRMNDELLTQRNPDYWQIAPDGERFPYADSIAFRPFPDSQQGLNAIASGEIDAMATSIVLNLYGPLMDMKEAGTINMLISADHAEVGYIMLNNGKPPFDDERMRRALAIGIDREKLNDLSDGGFAILADQPFPPGDMGYVDEPGFPEFDEPEAKRLVDAYVADGGKAEITLHTTAEPSGLARCEIIHNMLGKIGINVRIRTTDQATVINEVLAGDYQATLWRQHAGGEADDEYIWWYSGAGFNPTNLARIDDPVINEALDQGRVELDPAKRKEIYERIPRRFAEKVYGIWMFYAEWGIALSRNVHGVLAAELPDGGGPVFTGLAGGHPLHAMWVDPD